MAQAYTLFSGSTGNCCYISNGDESILIDAGVSCRKIKNALLSVGDNIENIKAVFITHEHNDHTKGLKIIAKQYRIPILCTVEVARSLVRTSAEIRNAIHIIKPGDTIKLQHMTVSAATAPHDSADHVCYRICFEDGEALGYATDIGHLSKTVVDNLTGCKYVVIESNHDEEMLKNGEYPYYLKRRILSARGHLSNKDCASLLPSLVEGGCCTIVLAHLSRENNIPELAYNECKRKLLESGVTEGQVSLAVAMPDEPLKII